MIVYHVALLVPMWARRRLSSWGPSLDIIRIGRPEHAGDDTALTLLAGRGGMYRTDSPSGPPCTYVVDCTIGEIAMPECYGNLRDARSMREDDRGYRADGSGGGGGGGGGVEMGALLHERYVLHAMLSCVRPSF